MRYNKITEVELKAEEIFCCVLLVLSTDFFRLLYCFGRSEGNHKNYKVISSTMFVFWFLFVDEKLSFLWYFGFVSRFSIVVCKKRPPISAKIGLGRPFLSFMIFYLLSAKGH